MGGEHRALEARKDRPVLGLRKSEPVLQNCSLLAGAEHFFSTAQATEAQRWGEPLLRAAMPLIRRQENRLARFGGERPHRRRP
jgi:hypothetical protein